MKHKALTLIALVVAGGVGAGSVAVATPGTGILGAPILARGTPGGDFEITLKDSPTPGDVIVQQVIIAPGGSTGWHTHPGPAVVIVKSGSLTLYDSDDPTCTGTTYSVAMNSAGPASPVGKVFVDPGYGHAHIGRNEGRTKTELYVTYLDVPAGAAPRIDVPNPGHCGF